MLVPCCRYFQTLVVDPAAMKLTDRGLTEYLLRNVSICGKALLNPNIQPGPFQEVATCSVLLGIPWWDLPVVSQPPETHEGLELSLPTCTGRMVRTRTSLYLCGPLCLDTVIQEAEAGCRATDIPHVLLPGNLGQLSPNHNSARQDPGGETETQVKLGTPTRAVRGVSHHTTSRCQAVA